ncbi:hypothetical protein B0H14DRAFT_2596012 [Mycena olivaceomarginata]|nr:hypothetical protein B0H14DRAFT_2596012 [Mycena olivaceomarginata]
MAHRHSSEDPDNAELAAILGRLSLAGSPRARPPPYQRDDHPAQPSLGSPLYQYSGPIRQGLTRSEAGAAAQGVPGAHVHAVTRGSSRSGKRNVAKPLVHRLYLSPYLLQTSHTLFSLSQILFTSGAGASTSADVDTAFPHACALRTLLHAPGTPVSFFLAVVQRVGVRGDSTGGRERRVRGVPWICGGHTRAGGTAGRVVHGERGGGLDAWEAWMRDRDCERGWPREDVSGEKATWKAAEGVLWTRGRGGGGGLFKRGTGVPEAPCTGVTVCCCTQSTWLLTTATRNTEAGHVLLAHGGLGADVVPRAAQHAEFEQRRRGILIAVDRDV